MKALLFLLVVSSTSVFAQDMSKKETYDNSNIEMPDGSSRYVGKCSTHEIYENFYFKKTKVMQKYVKPYQMEKAEIKAVYDKLGETFLKEVFKVMGMNDVAEPKEKTLDILEQYIDDIYVEKVSHVLYPEMNLIRASVGVGGGNGGYVVMNRKLEGKKFKYELVSYTFDGDVNFCDKSVWLINKTK